MTDKNSLITKALAMGIPVKSVDEVQKTGVDALPFNEAEDVIVFLGKGVASIITGDFSYLSLAKSTFEAVSGIQKVPGQILDMSEDELMEGYKKFKENFNLDPEDKQLELLIEESFLNQLKQLYDILAYVRAKEEK